MRLAVRLMNLNGTIVVVGGCMRLERTKLLKNETRRTRRDRRRDATKANATARRGFTRKQITELLFENCIGQFEKNVGNSLERRSAFRVDLYLLCVGHCMSDASGCDTGHMNLPIFSGTRTKSSHSLHFVIPYVRTTVTYSLYFFVQSIVSDPRNFEQFKARF